MTKASDFIKPGERILVVFTKGTDFELSAGNTGITGEWPVDFNKASSVDRVLIYHRNIEMNRNDLYIANRGDVNSAETKDRYNIQLRHVQYVGTTALNWKKFADTDRSSIRYLP